MCSTSNHTKIPYHRSSPSTTEKTQQTRWYHTSAKPSYLKGKTNASVACPNTISEVILFSARPSIVSLVPPYVVVKEKRRGVAVAIDNVKQGRYRIAREVSSCIFRSSITSQLTATFSFSPFSFTAGFLSLITASWPPILLFSALSNFAPNANLLKCSVFS